MAFKHKFTYEEKVKIVSEYIGGASRLWCLSAFCCPVLPC